MPLFPFFFTRTMTPHHSTCSASSHSLAPAFLQSLNDLGIQIHNAPYISSKEMTNTDAKRKMLKIARTVFLTSSLFILGNHFIYIKAISLGAVFFGANTYIGNGPNFMVKSIADQSGVHTPHFLEYVYKYSLPILFPIFALAMV